MKWKINSLQLFTFILYPIIESIIGIGFFIIVAKANIDSYFSVIIMTLIGSFYLLMIIYISNFNHNLPISKITTNIYGKYIGNILNAILIIISIIIGATILFSISGFISSQFLSRTPTLIIILLLLSTVYVNVSKGFQSISRVSLIIMIINVFLIVVAILGVMPEMELDNFKPVLEHGLKNPFVGGILITLTNILPIFLVLTIPKNNITDKKNYNKVIIISYVISTFIFFLITIFTIGILSKYLISIYQYPEYIILQKISFLNFIERIENLITMQWIFGCIIYLSLLTYYIGSNFKMNGDKINNFISLFILIIFTLITFFFKNNIFFNNYLYNIYPYICLGIFPVILLLTIGVFVKKKKLKKSLINI